MFTFDNATTASPSGVNQILEPGLHLVKTEKIEHGLSQNTKAPFLDWFVVNDQNQRLNNRYYLNTSVAEGKTKSAWDISQNAILQLVMASNNLSEEAAKSKLNELVKSVTNEAELSAKLSNLCVGKEFRIKVVGKETIGGKGNFIKSEFGSIPFAESTKESKLKFDIDKNIKRLPSIQATPTTDNTNW